MFFKDNIKWNPLLSRLLLALCALGIAWSIFADGRSAQFNQVYGRYLQRSPVSVEEQSERAHLIWMAYLLQPQDPAVLLEMSHLLWEQGGDPEQALRLLAEAFDYSHQDYYIGLELLEKSAQLDKWDYAAEVGRQLQQQNPDDVQLRLMLVAVYEQSGKIDLALEVLRGLSTHRIMRLPSNLLRYAGMLWQAGDRAEAVEVIQSYMQEYPEESGVGSMLFLFYGSQGEPDLALEELRRQLALEDTPIEVLTLAAAYLAEQGMFDEVVEVVQRIKAKNQLTPDELLELLQMVMGNASHDAHLIRAMMPVKEAWAQDGGDKKWWETFSTSLAYDHLVLGDSIYAEHLLNQLIESETEISFPYYYFVQKYGREQDTLALKGVVEQGLVQLPEDGLLNLFSVYVPMMQKDTLLYQSRLAHAIEVVSQEDPVYGQLAAMKAQEAIEAGDWEEGKRYFEIALLHPTALIYNNYAWSLAIHGEPEDLVRAEELSSLAIKEAPEQASHLDTHAWILYLRGEYILAEVYMARAIRYMEEGDDKALYYEHYAKILEAQGKVKEALEAWRTVLEEEPEHEEALQRVGELSEIIK